jgi:hypothetical protein
MTWRHIWEWRSSSDLLELGSREIWVVCPCRFSSGERTLGTLWLGCLADPGVGLDAVDKSKSSTARNLTRAVQPVARLYTVRAILTAVDPCKTVNIINMYRWPWLLTNDKSFVSSARTPHNDKTWTVFTETVMCSKIRLHTKTHRIVDWKPKHVLDLDIVWFNLPPWKWRQKFTNVYKYLPSYTALYLRRH